MSLKGIFSNNFETADPNLISELTTHYYSNNYDSCKDAVLSYARSTGIDFLNIDDNFHEILLSDKHAEIIVTFVSINYRLTSIDFKINTNYIIAFGKGKKQIVSFYEYLDRTLQLKQVGGGYNNA